ncbi:MAG TPA: hypothetical protein VHH90_02260 [Polyangia bacterium]|nr:hypothetical protein [Polyangia bacterium]
MALRSTSSIAVCLGSIRPSSSGKTSSDGDAAIAFLRYGSSSLLIGIASTRPPFGMSRSCERPTRISPEVKSTSGFCSAKSSPFRIPV